MGRIVRSSRAKADVLAAARYIAKQSQSRATAYNFIDTVDEKLKLGIARDGRALRPSIDFSTASVAMAVSKRHVPNRAECQVGPDCAHHCDLNRVAAGTEVVNFLFIEPKRDGLTLPPNERYHSGMTVQTFRELLTLRPFKPFRLVMSSGQTYDVRHPEMALLTRSDLLVGIDEAEDGVPAEFKICSLLHVSAIEPISPASPGSN